MPKGGGYGRGKGDKSGKVPMRSHGTTRVTTHEAVVPKVRKKPPRFTRTRGKV